MSPDLAKFAKFNKSDYFLSKYLVRGKIVNLLDNYFFTIGQIFIVLNGQILNKQFSHLVTLLATRRKDENIR